MVQKSFGLISNLPDKVLRWIGGQPESVGQEAAQWGDETKQKIGDAGKSSSDAQGQMGKNMGGKLKRCLMELVVMLQVRALLG